MKQTKTCILSYIFVISLVAYKTYATPQDDKEFLDAHNKARLRSSLPALSYDQNLANIARKYASARAGDCALKHSHGPHGENLFWGAADGASKWTPKDAVYAWVKEHNYYDKVKNSCMPGKKCGHYTQLMWRDTKKVGCALSHCKGKDTYVVCEYDPPGNIEGLSPFLKHDPSVYNNTERL